MTFALHVEKATMSAKGVAILKQLFRIVRKPPMHKDDLVKRIVQTVKKAKPKDIVLHLFVEAIRARSFYNALVKMKSPPSQSQMIKNALNEAHKLVAVPKSYDAIIVNEGKLFTIDSMNRLKSETQYYGLSSVVMATAFNYVSKRLKIDPLQVDGDDNSLENRIMRGKILLKFSLI